MFELLHYRLRRGCIVSPLEGVDPVMSGDTCQTIMDAYRHGDFTGWTEMSDGTLRISLGDIAQLCHTTDGSFELNMGGGWVRVDSIEWRSGIHIRFPCAQLIVYKEDA